MFRFLIPFTPFTPFTPQRPQGGPPSGPPPAFIPQMPIGTFAVDPGAISNCLFRFTYIWPFQLRPFWFFPTFVGPRSVAGYRWNGFSWNYFGIDLREIRFFQCF
ncbi:MAG: transporter [Clostridiaceae bacterium]|nr:transporter [Clostridiaceae bacterium]